MILDATAIVRTVLEGSGVEVVSSCGIGRYDACAPGPFRSAVLMNGARGLIVAGSAGPVLWRRFCAHMGADPARWDEADPLDHFVEAILARVDAALAAAGVA